MARPATISITPDGSGAAVSPEMLNAIRSLLRASARHSELLIRLERNLGPGPAGGATINLCRDPALAADLAAAITAQLPKPGARASSLQQTMVHCAATLGLHRPPMLKESAIHAWDCLCGERNSPAQAECRVCRGTVANGKIVPAIRADAATVVRRGPSAMRPSEALSVQLPAPRPELVPMPAPEIPGNTRSLTRSFRIDRRLYLITGVVVLTAAGVSLFYWSFLLLPIHPTALTFLLFVAIAAMKSCDQPGRRSRGSSFRRNSPRRRW